MQHLGPLTDKHFASGILLNCMVGFVKEWSKNTPIFVLGQFQKFFLPLFISSLKKYVQSLLLLTTTLYLLLLVKTLLRFSVDT